jgi:uncharacterized membrane protein
VTGSEEAARGKRWSAAGAAAMAGGLVASAVGGWRLIRGDWVHGWDERAWVGPFVLLAGGLLLLVASLLLLARGTKVARAVPATFLHEDEEQRVLEAIARFEARTSGEIRVHLARSAGDDIQATARHAFEHLGLTATRERNGVLFYVAVHDRRFAVLGDSGINQKVPPGFWDQVVQRVGHRFRQGQYGEGLVEGLALAGDALATHFPPREDDSNELPDSISREPH